MKQDKSKRAFFKKIGAVAGLAAAAGYVKGLVSGAGGTDRKLGYKYVNDAKLQEITWSEGKLVQMTEQEKQDMLNVILNSHHNQRS